MTDHPRVLWHYTTGRNLRSIVRDGWIVPTGELRGEKPAVWFTACDEWEPGASMGTDAIPGIAEIRATAERIRLEHGEDAARTFLLGFAQEIAPAFVGFLARIGVAHETAPFTWDDFKRMSGAPDRAYREVEAYDNSIGADNREWRVSFDPVPASKWLAVEVRSGRTHDERWEPAAWR